MKSIFVVDDKEAIGKIISIYLSKEYKVIWFETPIKAISYMQNGHIPDLIISDIKMPKMRGDEFLEYLKNNDLYKSIKVIMLSGEDSTSERIRLLSNGADDYLVKPFNPVELKIRVTKLINNE